ncbi:MAG: adenylate kinase [Chloroflexota bacterium]
MIVVLLGAPGSGKGTQGKPLAVRFGLAHVASGDLFRGHMQRGTELGRLAKSYVNKGLLVPDDVTIRIMLDRMTWPDSAGGVILDGFPRTLDQAQALDQELEQEGKRVDHAPYVVVSTDELLSRLGGRWVCRLCSASYNTVSNAPRVAGRCDLDGGELYQRPDDSLEVARKRLQVYFEQTEPVVDYYRRREVLREVNGDQSIDGVFRDLVRALDVPAIAGSKDLGARPIANA